MTRRLSLLLLLPLAAGFAADSETEVRDVVAATARALSGGKVELFLDSFDPKMPGFDKLRDNIAGLTAQADVSCNVEILQNDGDDSDRTLTLDWILGIESKDTGLQTSHREKTVKCQLKKIGKKWRIVAFEPLDLFASPGA